MRADHTGKRRVASVAFLLAAMILSTGRSWAAQSATPSKFDIYLAQGYRKLGNLAARSAGEGQLSAQFHKRALLATSGAGVSPLTPAEANATGWTGREAGAARKHLISQLESGAREHQPLLAAMAQVNFDCWVQPLPKGIGSTDGDECRRRFYFALAGLGPDSIREASLMVSPLALPRRAGKQTASPPIWPREQIAKAKGCPDFVVNGLCTKIVLVGPTADMLIPVLGGDPERQDLRIGATSLGPAEDAPGGLVADPAGPNPTPAGSPSNRSQDGGGPLGGATGRDPAGTGNGAAAAAGGTGSMGNGTGDSAGSAAGSPGRSNGAAGSAAGSAASAAGAAASGAANAAGNAASDAASAAGNAASGAATAAGNAASDAASAAGNAASSAANAAGSAASSAGSVAGNAASTAGEAAGAAASSAGSAASGAVGAAGSAVGGAVHGAAGSVGSAAGHGGLGL